jgi:hypothetical protein
MARERPIFFASVITQQKIAAPAMLTLTIVNALTGLGVVLIY